MFDKMKKLEEMQKQAEKIKKELENVVIKSEDVEGIVVTTNGAQEVKSIEISQYHYETGNKEKFEADLVKAIDSAMKKSQAVAAQKMKDIFPGLPGI